MYVAFLAARASTRYRHMISIAAEYAVALLPGYKGLSKIDPGYSATKQRVSSAWASSLTSAAHNLDLRNHYWASKQAWCKLSAWLSLEQVNKLSLNHPAQSTICCTHLTGICQWPSALTEFPRSAVLDWLKKSWALIFHFQQLLFKDHQIPIVVYHLVSAPINNCSQALLCVQGFLHACTLVVGRIEGGLLWMLYYRYSLDPWSFWLPGSVLGTGGCYHWCWGRKDTILANQLLHSTTNRKYFVAISLVCSILNTW